MGSYLKNFMLPAGNWVIEVAVDEPEGLDRYLNEESVLYEHNHMGKLPDVIGILPIRNAVVFPGTVTPLAIGRDKSRRLLEDTKPNRSVIGLVTQRDPGNDEPGFGDLYSVRYRGDCFKGNQAASGFYACRCSWYVSV